MCESNLTPKQVFILISIIGDVDPVADSAIDSSRLNNLKMLELVGDYINETIFKISKECSSPYGSVKTMGKEAYDWVKFWRDTFSL